MENHKKHKVRNYSINYSIATFFCLGALLALYIMFCNKEADKEKKLSETEERVEFVIHREIDYAMAHGDVEKGIALANIAERIYTDYPGLPFIKGMAYYNLGNKQHANAEFHRAYAMYDSLLKKKPNINHAYYKAVSLQMLGDSAGYNRELDSIQHTELYRKELPSLDFIISDSREITCEERCSFIGIDRFHYQLN
ncbi:MAG: hypothetical protein NC206_09850 [Bacteroides sp.]|nr:hypothetical protein [Roseburia sp.]MCM1347373.1 hypothetical protein [Bacteroides sp.]MCM1421864.1 hypothetical protein [Bacteroides sp.]